MLNVLSRFTQFTCLELACVDFSFSWKLSVPSKCVLLEFYLLFLFSLQLYQINIYVEENESQYWYYSSDDQPGEEGVVFGVGLVPPQLRQLHPRLLLYDDEPRLVVDAVIGREPDHWSLTTRLLGNHKMGASLN